jgi:hypothetical protein
VPFALRTDRDDVACWDLDADLDGRVTVLGDFEVPGFEQGEVYPTFSAWFRAAVRTSSRSTTRSELGGQ